MKFGGAIIVLIPYVAVSGGFDISGMQTIGYLSLVTVGLVHTVFAYCLCFSGLKAVPGHEAALRSYIDPLLAVVVSVVFLMESFTWVQLIGGIMILGFTLINELQSK